jgi:hypothetical protein
MRTARRVYLYAISFVSLQTILWAIIGLARVLLFPRALRATEILAPVVAGALSVLIVGVPFFLIHWLIAQRMALRDSEERSAAFRSFFHYALMTSTAIPALLGLLQAAHYIASRALGIPEPQPFLGYTQSLPTFLIQVVVMGAAWGFGWRLASDDAHALPEIGARASLRRLYRYGLTAFGLALTASAAGMFVSILLEIDRWAFGALVDRLAIGLALAVVGVPLWVASWGAVQRAFAAGGEETESTIRKVYLYLTCLVGSLSVIVASAGVLSMLLQYALGVSQGDEPFLSRLAQPLTVIVVGGAVWGYHAQVLAREASAGAGRATRPMYHYLMATLGLGASLIGALFLVDAASSALAGDWSPGLRISLAHGLATLGAGLPVWLTSWSKMQRLAWQPGEGGEEARRAPVRRGYLYLVAFAGAVGLLASLAGFVSLILSHLLGGDLGTPLSRAGRGALDALLFAAFLAYHLYVIRSDGRFERRSRAEVLSSFPIALVGPETWTTRFRTTLQHSLPGVPIREHASQALADALSGTQAVLFPASLLATWPEHDRARLSAYTGLRLPVPENEPQWGWVGLVDRSQAWQAEQAARAIELAAFGQPVRSPRAVSPWAIAGGVLLLVILIPIALAVIMTLVTLAGLQ